MASVLRFGILTVIDTCYNGEKLDTSGTKLSEEIKKAFPNSEVIFHVAPDEQKSIEECLQKWCDQNMCDVLLTTGGTGSSPRDVTTEATLGVIDKEASGLAYASGSAYTMVTRSLVITGMAILSRSVCGIRKKTLIVNLPGSEKSVIECFGFIKNVILHAVNVLTDRQDLVMGDHKTIQTTSTADSIGISPSKVKVDAARNRLSPYPLVEVSEAKDVIKRECCPTLDTEVIPFHEAVNRVLAEDVFATEPVPPFRASIKDGYAVKSADGAGSRRIREFTAAGDKPIEEELKPGEAIRVSTGAAVPPGADAVVQVEDTVLVEKTPDDIKELSITINKAPVAGQDIREIGSDIKSGGLVLKRFDHITPAHVGVLAMLGKTDVNVYKKPSIGVLSTGNEIKDPSDNVGPGQIRDCNRSTLLNFLKKYSYEASDLGMVRDDPNSVKRALHMAFLKNDLVITSGGVSMGEFDIIKQVLVEDFNAIIHFARVNMKPGKPTTFATCKFEGKTKIVFALPGNPVSCGVTCLLFVIPTLRHIERSVKDDFPVVLVPGRFQNQDTRPEYHRVTVSRSSGFNGNLQIESTGNQISSRLNSLVGANGLALIPGGTKFSNDKSVIYNAVILFDDII